jgi:hypothetical protein
MLDRPRDALRGEAERHCRSDLRCPGGTIAAAFTLCMRNYLNFNYLN